MDIFQISTVASDDLRRFHFIETDMEADGYAYDYPFDLCNMKK